MYFELSSTVCINDLFELCHNCCHFFLFNHFCSAEMYRLDLVIMKGIPLMYMMSTARVALPCSSSMPLGNLLHELIVTLLAFSLSLTPKLV